MGGGGFSMEAGNSVISLLGTWSARAYAVTPDGEDTSLSHLAD